MSDSFMGVPVIGGHAGDVFADEAIDMEFINGTVRLRFAVAVSTETVNPSARQFVHVGRLVMPAESAQRLCLGLYDFLKNVGLDPAALAGASPSDLPN
jgi:hypothetical protein